MTDDLLKQQLAYYRARALEYDESVQLTGRFATESRYAAADREWAHIVEALHALAPVDSVLELACGTGMWTEELIKVGTEITALDGAPEMLDANRAKLHDAKIEYRVADLFDWTPDKEYGMVFFGFWLSHVPPQRLNDFLNRATASVRVGGRIFMVDEPAGGVQLSGANEAGMYQQRELYDGRTFQIVKVYYDPSDIQAALQQRGFQDFTTVVGECYFSLSGTRAK